MVAGFQTMPPTWTLPPKLPYKEGDLIPKGYHIEERRRPLVLIFGGLLTISSYTLCAAFAGSGLKNAQYGYIPFVGPFIAMAKVETYKGDTTLASFVMAGIGEIAGAALLGYGIIATEPWLVRNKEQAKKAAQVYMAPTFGKSGGGLGVLGSF